MFTCLWILCIATAISAWYVQNPIGLSPDVSLHLKALVIHDHDQCIKNQPDESICSHIVAHLNLLTELNHDQ